MDMNGNSIARSQAGKLLAVFWILAAAFAMQVVASAQVISSRFSAQQSAGNLSSSESGTSDTTLSRHVIRSLPADLRFIADRSDGKVAPGGPQPFTLPSLIGFSIVGDAAGVPRGNGNDSSDRIAASAAWARAPPGHIA